MKLHRQPRLAAPPLTPWEWANGAPGGLEAARGKVVLIDFFSWSDPEVVRTLPSIEALAQHYRTSGLETFGVHVPVEEFERPLEAARDEIWRLGLGYPVALDLTGDVCRAYENRVLPGRFLVDRVGFVRGWRHGLGGEREIEAAIRLLLSEPTPGETSPDSPTLPPAIAHLPSDAPVVWAPSPPIRFAMNPDEKGAAEGFHTFPELPEVRAQGAPYFEGVWDLRRDRAIAAAPGARLAIVFEGAGVSAVISPPRDAERTLRLDVVLDGEAFSSMTIDRGRVYDLGRVDFGVHHLDLAAEPGLAVHRIHFDPMDAPVR